jgi:hypothetical protein
VQRLGHQRGGRERLEQRDAQRPEEGEAGLHAGADPGREPGPVSAGVRVGGGGARSTMADR